MNFVNYLCCILVLFFIGCSDNSRDELQDDATVEQLSTNNTQTPASNSGETEYHLKNVNAEFTMLGTASEGAFVKVIIDEEEVLLSIEEIGAVGRTTTYFDSKTQDVQIIVEYNQATNLPTQEMLFKARLENGELIFQDPVSEKSTKNLPCIVRNILSHSQRTNSPYPTLFVRCSVISDL